MAEPLIDLTEPPAPKPRRQTTPRPSTARAKVARARTGVAKQQATKEERAEKYQKWIEENWEGYHLRGAAFVLGADPRAVQLPQPDGTAKSVAEVIQWTGTPKPFMAAQAIAGLEELPQVQTVIRWFGPIAPWLMLGGVGVATGIEVVTLWRIRQALRVAQATPIEEAAGRPEAQAEAAAAA